MQNQFDQFSMINRPARPFVGRTLAAGAPLFVLLAQVGRGLPLSAPPRLLPFPHMPAKFEAGSLAAMVNGGGLAAL
eukprot:COSAG02_NODE_50151_length_322_cov_0.914798_1_plen_75_part_10